MPIMKNVNVSFMFTDKTNLCIFLLNTNKILLLVILKISIIYSVNQDGFISILN